MVDLGLVGFIPLDVVNFPGRLAATIFTQGCPLRCPYCHNPGLVLSPEEGSQDLSGGFTTINTVLEHLRTRRGFLSGVVISGGEPCIHGGIGDIIDQVYSWGYEVKLDTSGVVPGGLGKLLNKVGLTNVALDLKTSLDSYARLGFAGGGGRVATSLKLLADWLKKEARNRLYLRTTLAPGITEARDLESMEALATPMIRAFPGQVTYTKTPFVATQCLDQAWAQGHRSLGVLA